MSEDNLMFPVDDELPVDNEPRQMFPNFDETPEGRRILGLDPIDPDPVEETPPERTSWWGNARNFFSGNKGDSGESANGGSSGDHNRANAGSTGSHSRANAGDHARAVGTVSTDSAASASHAYDVDRAYETDHVQDAAPDDLDEVVEDASQQAVVPQQVKRVDPPASQSRAGTYVVVGCIVLLVAFTVLGSMLNVGDHLSDAHPVLGWVFYGLLVVLVIVGIIVPLVKVAKRPIFSLYQLHDEEGHAKRRRCQMLVDNLVANADLTDEEVIEVQGFLQKGDEADDLLINFFTEHCTPKIDAETKRAATTAFFIAAVARSPLISMVTMLSLCLDLVRAIVELCGFRPTNLGLARLYTRVMISALIIGGIEDSDLSDLLGQLMGGGAGARAGGIVLGATAEGLVSAFLVFRVGVITKRWLTAADGPERMSSIRRTSYREALALMRTSGFMQMVTETMKETTSSVATSAVKSVKNAAKNTVDAAKSALFISWDQPERGQ